MARYSNFLQERINLLGGEYCVEIISNCYERIFCFEVPHVYMDIEVDLQFSSTSCYDNTVIVEAEGDNPPFDYEWNTGHRGPALTNVVYGVYEVTVTDNNGCEMSESINMTNVRLIDKVDACKNQDDGRILLEIDNPNNSAIDVGIQFAPAQGDWGDYAIAWNLIDNSTSDPIELDVNGLAAGIYVLEIDMWNPYCSYTYEFTIEESEFEKFFSEHRPVVLDGDVVEHLFECVYDIECNDVFIEDGYVQQAELQQNGTECEGNGGIVATILKKLDCGSVDVICEDSDQIIETIVVPDLRMRGGEHQMMLGGPTAYADIGIDVSPCAWVRACPNKPNCWIYGMGGNLLGGNYIDFDWIHDDCYKIHCDGPAGIWNYDFEVCGIEHLPEHWERYITQDDSYLSVSIESCDYHEENVYELLLHKEGKLDNISGFYESELEEFLDSDEVKNNMVATLCATVGFCLPNFTISKEPDLENIDCDLLLPMANNNYFDIENYCEPFNYTIDEDEDGQPDIMYVMCEGSSG